MKYISCEEVIVLIEKFGGILVGSAAAKENGINVIPRDYDLVFKDEVAVKVATNFLALKGWEKELVGGRYGLPSWYGGMSDPGRPGLHVDLFVGRVDEAVGGVASNMEVLRGHLERRGESTSEYTKMLFAAIVA